MHLTIEQQPGVVGDDARALDVVRDDHEGQAQARLCVFDELVDAGARLRIKAAGRLIKEDELRGQGHGAGQEVLQTGKRLVELTGLEPVGNYAVQPAFSDGHESGIFSWDYLYFLGSQEASLWQQYEQRLQAAGRDRDGPMPAPAGHGCASH